MTSSDASRAADDVADGVADGVADDGADDGADDVPQHEEAVQSEEEARLQRENAETSLDQPSS